MRIQNITSVKSFMKGAGRTSVLTMIFAGAAAASIFFFIIYPKFFLKKKSVDFVYFNGKDVKVGVELAANPFEWGKGLMFRDSLDEGKGMLFIFPDENKRSFWMKNTQIPLDIIFISENKKVIDIKENFEPCANLVCPRYDSKSQAMYVLEVNAGFVKTNKISSGDLASFEF